MITTSNDYDFIFFHLIYQPVLTVNSARPATGKLKSEWFGLAGSLKWSAASFFEQGENAVGKFFVRLQPITKVVKSCRGKDNIHIPRASMGMRLPDFASSRDFMRREALAGFESRYSLSMIDS